MSTTPDPNDDPALAGSPPDATEDGSASTEQLLGDAEESIAASTLERS